MLCLADAFKTFQNLSNLEHFKLDPQQFNAAPGLAKDCS